MLDARVWTIRYRQLRVTCKWYKNKYNFSKQPTHKRVKYINMNIQQIKIPWPLVAPQRVVALLQLNIQSQT
jgi:hypothetical protein